MEPIHSWNSFPRIRGDAPHARPKANLLPPFSPHTRGCSALRIDAKQHDHVFPAYAGMLRMLPARLLGIFCFPRIRGDAPRRRGGTFPAGRFSPHTRGCSYSGPHPFFTKDVFPAYAGMLLPALTSQAPAFGFPRIRGDAPWWQDWLGKQGWFSPHTRGCSGSLPLCGMPDWVFPAYAGMLRAFHAHLIPSKGFPRIRGDAPRPPRGSPVDYSFSPHTRGCSLLDIHVHSDPFVFPAYAGMLLIGTTPQPGYRSFPRIRGDAPAHRGRLVGLRRFSPHTRGCSASLTDSLFWWMVFPAYAGMLPGVRQVPHPHPCFPRIRGDAPVVQRQLGHASAFSPHTRGCSIKPGFYPISQAVFPAYAGMLPPATWLRSRRWGFPRIRGDAPFSDPAAKTGYGFSPHTRGCSGLHLPRAHHRTRFPRIRGDAPPLCRASHS